MNFGLVISRKELCRCIRWFNVMKQLLIDLNNAECKIFGYIASICCKCFHFCSVTKWKCILDKYTVL